VRARTGTLLALAASLLFVGCSDDDDDGGGLPGPTLLLAGQSTTTPSVEGSWVLSATPAVAGCGAFNILFPTEAVLTIVQAGNTIEFSLADACGRPLPGGEGQVGPDRIVEMGSDLDRGLTANCTLKVDQVRIGPVETPPDVFSGSDVLTISGSDDSAGCDPSLPCTVTGTFTATRCPRSGCAVTCLP